VLAPGAGADLLSDFMSAVATGLASRGVGVFRFNFLYMERGRKSPDRQPVLESTWRAVLDRVQEVAGGRPVVAGGKSMGGRIASHIVADGAPAAGLAFLGYPLHPPGRPERQRAAHLSRVDVPMLFVAGTRDPLCPLDTLRSAVAGLTAPVELAVIDDGDHSLRVRSSSGRSTAQAWAEVVETIELWLGNLSRT
jgi:uncharacterized protein